MSEIPSQLDSSLVSALSELLQQCQFDEAVVLIKDNRFSEVLKNNCTDLIPSLAQYLRKDAPSELKDCCIQLLKIVAQESNPEDAMFEFLELVEPSDNIILFSLSLKLLQICLLRMDSRRKRTLEWCFNAIYFYVKDLPLPKNLQLEGKETMLLDADPKVQRVYQVYEEIEVFYYPFITECYNQPNSQGFTQKNIITCFLLKLLGPLGYLNLESEHPRSSARNIAEKIVCHISMMVSDLYMLLPYAEERCLWKKRYTSDGVHEESVQNIFANEENTPLFSLAILYYLILSEKIYKCSCIYRTEFIALTSLFLSVEMLKVQEQFVLRKGLALAKDSLNLISVLPACTLNNPIQKLFCTTLTNVISFYDSEAERKLAISIFDTYVFKFDCRGRYLIISNLVPVLKHNGLIGHCITHYKNMIAETLDKEDNNPSYYFSGKRLLAVLNMFTQLPVGAESDLAEMSDQIISALNLLRYLLIRDINNKTGIRNYFMDICKTFLEPLHEAIKLSKAHYEVKKIELQKDQKQNMNPPKKFNNIEIIVAGCQIPDLDRKQKLNVLSSALSAFDVMESLLIRVNECFSINA